MATIALELVPAAREDGRAQTLKEGRTVKRKLREFGLLDNINTVLIPQVIPEDEYRPAELEDKLDPIDTKRYLSQELPVDYITTQVTVYTPMSELKKRVKTLAEGGANRIIFIGAPRQENVEMNGPTPVEAYRELHESAPPLGAILIPTRESEHERFTAKLDAGASFGVTQLLFSDAIVDFLGQLQKKTDHRPEIVLSFGYIPKAESRVGLCQWMIWDENPTVQAELETIKQIAPLPFEEKKAWLVDHYKRVVEGALQFDFPIGVHFEAPYGTSKPALETFAAMLEVWSPEEQMALSQ